MNSLTDLVRERIEVRWDEWSQRHPKLAGAIDRVELAEAGARRLRDDPVYLEAMRQANLDENQLLAAARVIEVVEALLRRGLL